mmetsp:Transcript_5195/g.12909  ORF Transcript_5195/g.12909 Transcript_5195/m.12909 type:complete len:327 (-) Transcript_5195:98-1078(-)
MLGAFEDERRGGVDRRGASTVIRVWSLAMVQHHSVEFLTDKAVSVIVIRARQTRPVRRVRRHSQRCLREENLADPIPKHQVGVRAPTVYWGLCGVVVREVIGGYVDWYSFRDVAVVLLLEGRGVVLHVVEHVEGAVHRILYQAQAGCIRVAQHAEARVCGQIIEATLGPTAQWHEKLVRETTEERRTGGKVAVTGASESFLLQVVLGDIVEIVEHRLGSPTHGQRPVSVRLAPLEDIFELVPIRDLLERHGLNRRASDYERVVLPRPCFREGDVKGFQMRGGRVARAVASHADQRQFHVQGARADQPGKLGLSRLLVGHQVHERDL